MKHVVKVQSRFYKELLTSFKVLSVKPPLTDNRSDWGTQRVAINSSFEPYIRNEKGGSSTLWLREKYNKPVTYEIYGDITHRQYVMSLKDWNKSYEDITVIDVGEKLLGEME